MTIDEYYTLVPDFEKRLEDAGRDYAIRRQIYKDLDDVRKQVVFPEEQTIIISGSYFDTKNSVYKEYEKEITVSSLEDFYKKSLDLFDEKMPGELEFGAKVEINE